MAEAKLSDYAKPHFEGCARGELMIPYCPGCERFFFYATVLCPRCHTPDWEWRQASGLGTVYSFTVVHRRLGPGLPAPYVVGVVELEEGVRLMTNLVDFDEDRLAIGALVTARFGTSWDGRDVALFAPAETA
jgi:uncharacterized OB-fold protein